MLARKRIKGWMIVDKIFDLLSDNIISCLIEFQVLLECIAQSLRVKTSLGNEPEETFCVWREKQKILLSIAWSCQDLEAFVSAHEPEMLNWPD